MKLNEEDGNVTLTAAGTIGAIVALLLVLTQLTQRIIADHEAQVAAELVAISAAYNAFSAHPDPCGVAAEVALRNTAELVACEPGSLDVQVTVMVRGSRAIGRAGPL